MVEIYAGPPVIATQPVSQTNQVGTLAAFSVSAGVGPPPFTYQWRKGATNLVGCSGITGSNSATLTLSNVLGANGGTYSVIVSNASGTVADLTATLKVLDPYLVSSPVPQSVNAGARYCSSAPVWGTTPWHTMAEGRHKYCGSRAGHLESVQCPGN